MHYPVVRCPHVGWVPLLSILYFGSDWVDCVVVELARLDVSREEQVWVEVRRVDLVRFKGFVVWVAVVICFYQREVLFPWLDTLKVLCLQVLSLELLGHLGQVPLTYSQNNVKICRHDILHGSSQTHVRVFEPSRREIPATLCHWTYSFENPFSVFLIPHHRQLLQVLPIRLRSRSCRVSTVNIHLELFLLQSDFFCFICLPECMLLNEPRKCIIFQLFSSLSITLYIQRLCHFLYH